MLGYSNACPVPTPLSPGFVCWLLHSLVLLQARPLTSSPMTHHKVFQHSSKWHTVKLLVGIPVYRRAKTPKHLGFWLTSAKSGLIFPEENRKILFSLNAQFFTEKLPAERFWSAFFLTGRQDEEVRKSMYKVGNNQPINMQSCSAKLICLLYSNQFSGHIFHLRVERVFPLVTWPPDLLGPGCGICPYMKMI